MVRHPFEALNRIRPTPGYPSGSALLNNDPSGSDFQRKLRQVLARLRDLILQLCHRASAVLISRHDIIRHRSVDIRMAKDGLDYFRGYAKAIEITSQPPSCWMPTVPFWNTLVFLITMA